MIEVAAFQKALGLALGFNTTFPLSIGRYGRFESRVLGENATDEQKAELKKRVESSRWRPHASSSTPPTSEHIYDNPAGLHEDRRAGAHRQPAVRRRT